jgi:hypothetical protein
MHQKYQTIDFESLCARSRWKKWKAQFRVLMEFAWWGLIQG